MHITETVDESFSLSAFIDCFLLNCNCVSYFENNKNIQLIIRDVLKFRLRTS